MNCLGCGRGFHDECDTDPCCCSKEIESTVQSESDTSASPRQTIVLSKHRRSDVTVSAGRKRAAKEYEIDTSTPCDWRGKANCGGGFKPVVGCIVGFQEARHHGPDKNTTNNESENIHLICSPCHNLWHRRNDPAYGVDKCPEGIQLHEPRWATLEELMLRDPL